MKVTIKEIPIKRTVSLSSVKMGSIVLFNNLPYMVSSTDGYTDTVNVLNLTNGNYVRFNNYTEVTRVVHSEVLLEVEK